VLLLPGGEALLADLLLSARPGAVPCGRVVGVLGALGGCGASTLSVAVAATESAGTALVVDADRLGGGIHLALGTEHEPGLRWDDLEMVSGALRPDLLTQALPILDGVRVLGWGTGETPSASGDPPGGDPEGLVPVEALRSVVVAARSVVDVTVIDLPRRLDARAAEHWRLLDAAVLVVPAQVRGVVVGRRLLDHLTAAVPDVHVVVMAARGGLAVATVADALACPVSGRWAPDRRLAEAAERGDLLHATRRGPTGRLARSLQELVAEHADGLVRRVA
jgi:secretion/DNA translocation related CpaE-like protein